jgi:hypothetical protein
MDEHRRRVLALLGAAGATPLAGCGFFDDDDTTAEDAKLAAEDGDEGDGFGRLVGVSSDGTTAVIGANNDEDPNGSGAGSAYVFQQEGEAWSEETKLTPEDGDSDDFFGISVGVSSDGTTAVIGASNDDNPNGFDAGSAYVFQRESGAWSEETKLTAEDGDSEDGFGESVGVSSDGTTALIGAPEDDNPNGENAGSAHVFQRVEGVWREETKLTAEDGDSGDFGESVGVSSDGTTAVIGAFGDEDPNEELAGSAYVFQRVGEEWREETKLAPEDGDPDDFFGISVGVSGDGTTAVIGANNDEDPNGTAGEFGGAGSAYVFQRESGAWSEETKLAPEDGDPDDFFGISVGVSGDGTTAVIGANNDEDPNGTAGEPLGSAGSAYVFQRESGAWSEETKLAPEDGDSEDNFGGSVGVSGDGTTALIGANNDEDPNGTTGGRFGGAGSAYVFSLGE